MTIKEIREWYGSKPEGKRYQKFLEKELVITLEALNRAHRTLDPPEKSLEEMLIEDNQRMRKAGNLLAEASLRVIREYDGLHRLSLAVAKWCEAVAIEGGRNKAEKSDDPMLETLEWMREEHAKMREDSEIFGIRDTRELKIEWLERELAERSNEVATLKNVINGIDGAKYDEKNKILVLNC
jgi:hypothetical protein